MFPTQTRGDQYYFEVQGHGRVSRADESTFRVYGFPSYHPLLQGGGTVHVTIRSVDRLWQDRMAAVQHPGVLALAVAELAGFPNPTRLLQLLTMQAEMIGDYTTQSDMWMRRFTRLPTVSHVPHGMARVANASPTFLYNFMQRQITAILKSNKNK